MSADRLTGRPTVMFVLLQILEETLDTRWKYARVLRPRHSLFYRLKVQDASLLCTPVSSLMISTVKDVARLDTLLPKLRAGRQEQ